jgi:PAS domain S-box-containing protein
MTKSNEADEALRVFVDHAPVAVIIHDPTGKMTAVNPRAEHLFGYTQQEMVGQHVEILMPDSLRRQHVEQRKTYLKAPQPRPMGIGLELRARRKDGHEFPVEISLSPLETSGGIFIAATIFDLTDRKRLEEQARLAAILQERASVARDLHDTLAQGFTGIIMNLEAAREASANLPEEAKARLQKAEQVARDNLEQVRRSLLELSGPGAKPVPDLVGSLRELAERAHSGAKTAVKFSLRGKPQSFYSAIHSNLLFIAQQATDNALRHGHAAAVHIALVFDEKELRLQVRDNGRGFDVDKAEHGLGLNSMSDRARYIGGRFILKSRPGKGTRIQVRIPLAATRSRLPEAPR